MPKTNQSINADLEDLLVSKGYDVTPLDSSGKSVPVADDSELMQFHFHRDGKDYGTVTVTIDGLQKLTVYYDDEIANSGGINESDDARGMNGTSWISLVKQLKKFAQQHQLGFVLKDTDRLRNDMKKRAHQKTLEESSQLKDDLEFMTESSFKKFYGVGKREFVAEGFGDVVKGIKRKVSGKEDPKDVEHTYGRIARSAIKHKTPDQAEKDIKRWEKVNKVVNKEGVAEGSIEEALQAPPTSTGNELLDEFIGRYVKDGWKYHGTNKRGGHEFRKRRYMPAALYGLKDGGVIESHNNGTRVSRFDSSGKRVAKLADGPLSEQGVTEGSSKRDQKDIEAIKAAIARLESQLKHPNADKADIQQSIAHEKKRLSLYGVTEAAYNPDTFVGKKGTYKGYGITQEGPSQWGISSSARKFSTLNAAKRHIDKNLVAEAAGSPSFRKGQKVLIVKHGVIATVTKVDKKWGYITVQTNNGQMAQIDERQFNQIKSYHGPMLSPSVTSEMTELLKNGTSPDEVADIMRLPVEVVSEFMPNQQGVAKDNQMKLDEGYYGNKKMSYNDDTPTVKMIIKHNKQIEETDQRFRHIERIFLETSNGERFVVETTKPSRARMFARHIAEGGGYKDERWNHIKELCEDIDALGGFIRATRSSEQFNESAQRMIGEAADKYSELKTTAKRLQTGRGYNSYFESYKPSTKNEDNNDLLEVFKHSSVDSRIERALPTLNKLGIRRGKLEEADMFEQWADSVIDESLDIESDRQSEAIIELFADELPVGPNAEVAIAELSDIIDNDDLYDRLRKVASVNPNNDARPQIIGWMQEQNTPEYRNILSKLEKEGGGDEDEVEVEKPNPSKSVEPEAAPTQNNPGPEDDSAGDMTDELPPLPPLKEGDADLASFKRLIGK